MDTGKGVFIDLAFKLQIKRELPEWHTKQSVYLGVLHVRVYTWNGGREGDEGAQGGCLRQREREILCAKGM